MAVEDKFAYRLNDLKTMAHVSFLAQLMEKKGALLTVNARNVQFCGVQILVERRLDTEFLLVRCKLVPVANGTV